MSTVRGSPDSGSSRWDCGSEMARLARIALGAAVLTMAWASPGSATEPRSSEGIWTGLEAVDLTGEPWTASNLLGRVVLLDFWATWCAPCLAELPNLRRIQEELAGDDLVILGVSIDTAHRRTVRSFLLRHEMSWPQIHDGRGLAGPLARHFGVEAVPRTVVVDRKGRMVAVDLHGEVLYTVLRNLVQPPSEEAPPSPSEVEEPASVKQPSPDQPSPEARKAVR